MNLRIATLIVGVITIVFGLVGLGFPEFAMKHLLGFAVDPSHSVKPMSKMSREAGFGRPPSEE